VTRQLSVRPLAVYDRGYGNASFVNQTADIEADLLLRLASCAMSGSPQAPDDNHPGRGARNQREQAPLCTHVVSMAG